MCVRDRVFVQIGVAVLVVSLASCGGARDASRTSSPPTLPTATLSPPTVSSSPTNSAATAPAGAAPESQSDPSFPQALATLDTLPIKGRAPKTGYTRQQFGDAWTDDVTVEYGHNGCDTRNDVLRRDLVDIALKPNTNGCVVLSGVLNDPYSGTVVPFTRGKSTSAEVQIDHLVALSDAWQKGAQQWSPEKRTDFANDPANLQATVGSLNQQKSDGDAATWLPPDKSYRCTYVTRIVDVKAKYGLWVTQAEHDAIAGVLTGCVGDSPPASDSAAPEPNSSPNPNSPAPEPAPTEAPPAPTPNTPETAGASVYYPSCKAAKQAGAAPLHIGEPGYRPGLDGDNDGVACER